MPKSGWDFKLKNLDFVKFSKIQTRANRMLSMLQPVAVLQKIRTFECSDFRQQSLNLTAARLDHFRFKKLIFNLKWSILVASRFQTIGARNVWKPDATQLSEIWTSPYFRNSVYNVLFISELNDMIGLITQVKGQ